MRLARVIALVGIASLILSGCEAKLKPRSTQLEDRSPKPGAPVDMKDSAAMSPAIITSEGGRKGPFDQMLKPGDAGLQLSNISFSGGEEQTAQYERKIIRNGDLTIQTKSPESSQRSLESVAASLGGFVVSSELTHSPGSDGSANTGVTIVMRVPAARFADAIASITKIDGRVLGEKITGEDVTEEYIDLDARLKSKRALEAQFLEIMKQAKKVPDALAVEDQLGEVRTEIERIEGRKHFLDNQSALSTITVHLQSTAPIVTATKSGFLRSISLAFGDCIDTGAGIINGFIRFLGVLIPVSLLIFLPVGLLVRFLIRRYWHSAPKAAQEPVAGEA